MSAFFESLQKELGKGIAQWLLAAGTLLFLVAAGLLQGDMHTARLVLFGVAGVLLFLFFIGLVFRSLHRRRQVQTHGFLDDYEFVEHLGLYRHKSKPGYFCGSCTPNGVVSPLQVHEHGWQCQINGCEKWHPNPDKPQPWPELRRDPSIVYPDQM